MSYEEDRTERRKRKKSGWDVQTPVTDEFETINSLMKEQQDTRLQTQVSSIFHTTQTKVDMSNRIYVGSVHYELKEADVRALFSPFGTVLKVEMSLDPLTNKSKGYCFIDYADSESAEAAHRNMNGFYLAGRAIKVGRPFHGQGAVAAPNATAVQLPGFGTALLPTIQVASSSPKHGILAIMDSFTGSSSSSSASMLALPSSVPSVIPAVDFKTLLIRNIVDTLHIDDVAPIFEAFGTVEKCKYIENLTKFGMKTALVEYTSSKLATTVAENMNNFNLAEKLLSIEVISNEESTKLQIAASLEKSHNNNSSNNLNNLEKDYKSVILKNMVSIDEVQDPELKDEIGEEAGKYGKLVEIEIKVEENEPKVILQYEETSSAIICCKAMNGRSFGNMVISAVLAP